MKAPPVTATGSIYRPNGRAEFRQQCSVHRGHRARRIAHAATVRTLAPSTKVAGIPFPTTGLGGVQVTIGGLPAAIYYVSSTQISAVVPYGVIVAPSMRSDPGEQQRYVVEHP